MEDLKELKGESWKVKALKNKTYLSKHLHLTRAIRGNKVIIDSHVYGYYNKGYWEGYVKINSPSVEILIPCIESTSFNGFVARANERYKKEINKSF